VVDLGYIALKVPKSIDFLNGHLLLGLRNGSIMEIKNVLDEGSEPRILMQSHFEGETWGLALCDNKIYSSGDDNQVMEFDAETKAFVRSGKISEKKPKDSKKCTAASMSKLSANKQARAVAVSPKHQHLVVCSNFGKVSVRSLDNFDKKLQTLKHAKEWSEVMRYSPDENFLAVGSHDDHLYVYQINAEGHYSLYHAFHAGSSFINALDWSLDGSRLRTTDGAHEMLFYNITEKTHDTHSTAAEGLDWATHSVQFGPDRTGIKPHECDNTHIRDCARSPDGTLLVTACEYSLLNVFDYPVATSQGCRSYAGHSEYVLRVLFSKDGRRMFSVGGQDKAII
jgi:WD40 repeat protein